MADAQRCGMCPAPAEARCDQCGIELCGRHRKVITSELGSWSRCPRCDLRNKIRERPLVRWIKFEYEMDAFVRLVWLLIGVVALVLIVLYRMLAGRPF
jgi:hypothetical protein